MTSGLSKFDILVAYEKNTGAIGSGGKLPWNIPDDMKRFRALTSQVETPESMNAIILGRKTLDGLPNGKPLPKRINIAISRTPKESTFPNLHYVTSFEDALQLCDKMSNINKVFVIGGGEIYRFAMQHGRLGTVFATEVTTPSPVTDVDATFPIELLQPLKVVNCSAHEYQDYGFRFIDYQM